MTYIPPSLESRSPSNSALYLEQFVHCKNQQLGAHGPLVDVAIRATPIVEERNVGQLFYSKKWDFLIGCDDQPHASPITPYLGTT